MILHEGISEEFLDEFFSHVEDDVLNRRESYKVEFKETFEWNDKKVKSKYLRTMASFANNNGGLLIFGVSDSPRTIVGVRNFESIDDADISNGINDNFNQQIKFTRRTYETSGKTLGIIQIFESAYKPVVCIKDSHSMKENDVYYRYNSKSAKIGAGELRQIIDERVKSEREKWITLLNNIAEVGIDKVGFMNLDDGEIQFTGNKVLIDEELLSELKIVDEYSLEKGGAPALKLKGEIDSSAQIIKQPYVIQTEDIFKAFLNLTDIADPIQFIKTIVYGRTDTFPIWFLISKLGSTKKAVKKRLDQLRSHTIGYKMMLQRVEEDNTARKYKGKYSLTTGSRAHLRSDVLEKFYNKQEINYYDEEEARTLLEALSNINPNNIEFEQVQESLVNIFNKTYPFKKSAYNYLFRYTLTLIDYLYFSERVK
ncbi:hypothetical protein N780_07625 [Pontibacillus chungwhensis BH030062]|uniref:Schlafen AlbA-2 domain-containing protein n=1 Tax=Pontibacillus chungwhensis BH030062 TaxID=1385513 RepID=A0A0A2UNY7_9BACI|nr:ATP-binding protein [Pontibacillus chungwhensis]KGP89987.1 hypothetical protein N780_07625 [Pontibacillus chungwhensis BH030062]